MKDTSGSSFHRLLIKGSYPILMISMRTKNSNHYVSKIQCILEHAQKSRRLFATSNKIKHSQNVIFDMRNLTPTPTPPSVKNKPRAKTRELIFKMLENQHNSQSLLGDFRHVIRFPWGYSTLCSLDKMDDFMDK